MRPRLDRCTCHRVILALERPCRVNQNVDLEPAKTVGQIGSMSVKGHDMLDREAQITRRCARLREIASSDKDPQRSR